MFRELIASGGTFPDLTKQSAAEIEIWLEIEAHGEYYEILDPNEEVPEAYVNAPWAAVAVDLGLYLGESLHGSERDASWSFYRGGSRELEHLTPAMTAVIRGQLWTLRYVAYGAMVMRRAAILGEVGAP